VDNILYSSRYFLGFISPAFFPHIQLISLSLFPQYAYVISLFSINRAFLYNANTVGFLGVEIESVCFIYSSFVTQNIKKNVLTNVIEQYVNI
jgi:hypothetical protein